MSNLTKAFDEVFKDLRTDPDASESESAALIKPDTRSPEEKRLHQLIQAKSGADYTQALYKAPLKMTAPVSDKGTMELAERVGLIGPSSRVDDLHGAIQRFHDLICVNATIKAAKMAGDVLCEAAGSHASIGILSHLVDQQRQLLVEVEDICGRDGHGAPLEEGESDLIDRVRAQIAAVAPSKTEALECEILSADFGENTITLEMKSKGWAVRTGTYWLGTTLPPIQDNQNHGDI